MGYYQKLSITAELLEDAHIGSGSGMGITIDAMCRRDRNGFPMIPATSFKGVLKDAAADAALQKVLFGESDAQQGEAVVSSLYCTESTRNAGDFFILHTFNSLTSEGVSEKDMLRVIEFIRAGTKLTGYIFLPGQYTENIEKSLESITAIGGMKTRGFGKVQFTCRRISQSEHAVETIPPPAVGVRLQLKNLDPVCLPSSTVRSNSIHTEIFLRGQRIKGAMYQYARTHAESLKEAADSIFSSIVSFGNGYANPNPANTAGPAGTVLPFPLLLKKHKYLYNDEGEMFTVSHSLQPFWSAETPQPSFTEEHSRQHDARPVKRPGEHDHILMTDADNGFPVRPEIQLQMRNHIEHDGIKHATALFSEEVLSENQLFSVDIILTSQDKLKKWTEIFSSLLSGYDCLRMGRGGVPFICTGYEFISQETQNYTLEKDSKWYLLFTSDTILRDEYHNFITMVDDGVLSKLLKIDPDASGKEKVKMTSSAVDTIRVTGYNSASGYRSVPKLAIRRGSAAAFTVLAPINISDGLSVTEDYDIGYGRMILKQQIPNLTGNPDPVTNIDAETNENSPLDLFNTYIKNLKNQKDYSTNQLSWLKSEMRASMIAGNPPESIIEKMRDRAQRRSHAGGADRQLHFLIQNNFNRDIFYLALRAYLADAKEQHS